jgi:hypothetical protein
MRFPVLLNHLRSGEMGSTVGSTSWASQRRLQTRGCEVLPPIDERIRALVEQHRPELQQLVDQAPKAEVGVVLGADPWVVEPRDG